MATSILIAKLIGPISLAVAVAMLTDAAIGRSSRRADQERRSSLWRISSLMRCSVFKPCSNSANRALS